MEPNPAHPAYLQKISDAHFRRQHNSVDLDEIRANLKLTPQQRLRKASFIANGIKEVRVRASQIFKPDA